MKLLTTLGDETWARFACGKTVYYCLATYEEREIPKLAGFAWSPVKKSWWTSDKDKASKLADYACDGVQDELVALRNSLTLSLASSRAASTNLEFPCPEGLEYMPFQRAGIEYAFNHHNTLVGDEPGLGKTIQAIGLINTCEEIQSVLVVCPATLKINWYREIKKWLIWDKMNVAIADSNVVPLPSDGYDIVICNYEMLRQNEKKEKGSSQTVVIRTPALKRIMSIEWDLLICDEAHKCKNYKSQQSKGIAQIKTKRRLYLTGTPIVNRPSELWNLISRLDPDRWNKSTFWHYHKRYCNASMGKWGMDLKGANMVNLLELQELLRSTIMVRRLKKDVLTELPAKRRSVIELDWGDDKSISRAIQAEKEAAERKEALFEELKTAVELAKAEGEDEYKTAVLRLRDEMGAAFTEMSALRRETAVAKIPYTVEHLRELIDSEVKVVCFAHHREVLETLYSEFKDQARLIYGGVSLEDRQAAVDSFQNDDSIRVIFVSILAGGVGITLTASSHAVFHELDWVPGNVSQAENRLHRIGQVESVMVQHLVLNGSLDVKLANAIIEKQKIIDAALDNEIEKEEPVTATEAPATASISRKQIEKLAGELTKEQCTAIHEGLRYLTGMDRDHANIQNGVGYNKIDGAIGHSLADRTTLSPKQFALGMKLLSKYKRQLGEELATQIFKEKV